MVPESLDEKEAKEIAADGTVLADIGFNATSCEVDSLTVDKGNLQVSKRVILFGIFAALVVGGTIGAFGLPYLRDVNAPDVLYIVGTPTINMTSNISSSYPVVTGRCNVNASLEFTCTISSMRFYHGYISARVFNKSGLAIRVWGNMTSTLFGGYVYESDVTTVRPHGSAGFTFQFQILNETYESNMVDFFGVFGSQCGPSPSFACGS